MSRAKWFIITFAGLVLLYSIAWLALTFSICQHLNIELAGKSHRIFGLGEDDYKIAFNKVSPAGFPFKFGMKIHGLSEESQSSMITHNEPVSAGYDLLHQRFYLIYSGGSLARPKPLNAGFGTKVEGEFAHYISYALSLKIPSIIKDPARHLIELVNFAEYVEFTAKNVKAHDLIDKALLLDESYMSVKFSARDKPYYHNLEELKANPPRAWHLASKAKVDNVAQGRRIAVASFVYGILPSSVFTCEVDVSLLTKAKGFSLEEFIKNSELESKVWHFADASEDSNISLAYKSTFENNSLDASLRYKSSSAIAPDFFARKIEGLTRAAQELINMDGDVVVLRPALNSFLENPKRFLPDKNNVSKIDMDLELKMHGVDNKFELDIANLSIFADDTGFRLKNTSKVDNIFDWSSSGVLSLNKYKGVIDFVTDYANQISDKKDDSKIVDLNKGVRKSFLRIISNHPESDSDDLVFDYEFSSNLSAGKIGTTTMSDVIDLYYTTLYSKAIEAAEAAPDFNKELQEIAPDLLSRPELIEKLRREKR